MRRRSPSRTPDPHRTSTRRDTPAIAGVALILLAVSLSGCLGNPAQTDTPQSDDSPTVVEDPDNYTYVDNASFETGGHVHDYWDGQEQVTVLDETTATSKILFGGPLPAVVFRSDAGKVVPQGTESVTVEVDWTEQPDTVYDRIELWVKTADDANATPVTEIQPGDEVTINATNAENDLPHRSLSAWEFQFVVFGVEVGAGGVEATDFLRFRGEVSMTVTAHRGLELPVFPAHPDLWKNRSEIELFSEDQPVTYRGHPTGDGSYLVFGAGQPIHSPDNVTIVPFDAKVVRIEFAYTATDPATEMELKFHAADTWEWTKIDPDTTDGDTRIYRIPLGPEMGDSPYATQSLWEIVPYPTQPDENGLAIGEYTISAYAVREA